MGCGAWTAPLLLLGYFSTTSSVFAWSVAFYALAIVFNYPHYMATLYRAYHTAEDFQKYRIFTVHITALVAATALLSHFSPKILPWIFTVYLTWSPWHYSGQNYGIFMMFSRRAGVQLSSVQRRALYSSFLISYAILFVSFHTGASSDPLFRSLGIPFAVAVPARLVLVAAFVVCAGVGVGGVLRQIGFRAALPSLTIFSTQFLWFLLPSVLQLSRGLQVPQSRYSTGLLAVMHSAQYLWITSYYAKREASAVTRTNWRPFAYFGILVVGGIALFIPGPWLASYVFHFDFTSSFLIFTALVNIHHFILDGAIWKLRDGRIAALLLSPQRQAIDGAKAVAGRFAAGANWVRGKTAGARMLQGATVLALVGLAVLDQFRYVKAINESDVRGLQQAAALNPYDTSLQMRLANKQFESGDYRKAEVAWKSAIAANRTSSPPRNALLRLLLQQGRFDQAYQLAGESAGLFPDDADWQVNFGILASKLGHLNQAKSAWERALEVDPSQTPAHLYLAELLEPNDAKAALPHYVTFLDLISNGNDPAFSAPDKLIPIVLRLGKCQERAGDAVAAEKSFQLARLMAQKAHLTDLQTIALMDDAQSKAASGRFADALPLYQAALLLDDASLQLNDISSSLFRGAALDWYNYGVALRDHGADPALAFACLVQSSELFKTLPPSQENVQQAAVVNKAMSDLEGSLGNSATKVRKDLRQNLLQAISVKN